MLTHSTTAPAFCAGCGKAMPIVIRPNGRVSTAKHCSQACRYRSRCSTLDRFWAQVDRSGECWLWTGCPSADGYGQLWIKGVIWKPSRLAWTLIKGPIPGKLCVLHNCPGGDNPLCCNPDHLWLGTRAENQADMARKGRSAFGERAISAKLTDAIVRSIREEYTAVGTHLTVLAARYSVNPHTIRDAIQRRTWRHVR